LPLSISHNFLFESADQSMFYHGEFHPSVL
jgi:hypothetical protein